MNRQLKHLHPVLGAILAMCVAQASAQPDEHVRGLVDQLDSQSWLERDLATLDLANSLEEISLSDLEFFLGDMTLSHEQRTRLVLACQQRFQTHPKGGLGVSFGVIRVGAIEVVPIRNNPNFPASEMLNPGDVIARVGDQILMNSFDLRAHILSREPGEMLPATIIRNGKPIKMELPLGSYGELTGAARLEPGIARRALGFRWSRKGIIVPEVDLIGSGINSDQWIAAAFPKGSAPDPRSPRRQLATAMIGGAGRLIETGLMTSPRRIKPWESIGTAADIMSRFAIKLAGKNLQAIDAQRELLEIEADNIRIDIENAVDEHTRKAMQEALDSHRAIIDDYVSQVELLKAKMSEGSKSSIQKTLTKPDRP